MTPSRISRIICIAAAVTGMASASSAWAQADETRAGTGARPNLASAHSDIAFMLLNGTRQDPSLATNPPAGALPLALQVGRVAERLRRGANQAYPDLPARIPGFAQSGFDIYIARADSPGTASSASGKIAVSEAFAALQPYDDWLAFVIAREMGHVIARHHEENSGLGMITSLVMNLILPGSSLLKSAASAAGSSIASGAKREQQAGEADAIAIRLLEAAGFELRDVSLSLRVAAARLDAGGWSQEFQKSTATLVFAARAEKRATASAALASRATTVAGFAAGDSETFQR
jgi:Zn-dependent protease with chaperone function